MPTNEPVIIKRLLDIGFYNFLIPFVETEEEAVLAAVVPPAIHRKIRGVSVSHRANIKSAPCRTISRPVQQKHHHSGSDREPAGGSITPTLLVTEGVDGIFVGPSDLAAAFGHLGNASHPDVQRAFSTFLPVPARCNRAAFWRQWKPMPAATWSGAQRLSPSAAISAYSAPPRRS